MAKPVRKRVSEWRERKTQEGGRSLSVWLEPETAQMMDALIAHHRGETVSKLVARAISSLHQFSCGPPTRHPASAPLDEPPVLPAAESVAPEVAAEALATDRVAPAAREMAPEAPAPVKPAVDMDLALQEIQRRLALGVPFKQIWKALLLDWIKGRQKQGASYQTIADELNAARIPTLSGKGQWEGGMIPTVLVLSF